MAKRAAQRVSHRFRQLADVSAGRETHFRRPVRRARASSALEADFFRPARRRCPHAWGSQSLSGLQRPHAAGSLHKSRGGTECPSRLWSSSRRRRGARSARRRPAARSPTGGPSRKRFAPMSRESGSLLRPTTVRCCPIDGQRSRHSDATEPARSLPADSPRRARAERVCKSTGLAVRGHQTARHNQPAGQLRGGAPGGPTSGPLMQSGITARRKRRAKKSGTPERAGTAARLNGPAKAALE